MIVISMGDGLGNQMFQYALSIALRDVYKDTKIVFDTYYYGAVNRHNGIELERVFGIEIPTCTHYQAATLADYHHAIIKAHPVASFIWLIRKFVYGPKMSFIFQEDPTLYNEKIFQLNDIYSYYFRGNWINEKYFLNCRKEIFEAFKFPKITDERNKYYLNNIINSKSVSIHIRGGDYLNNTNLVSLNENYYTSAIKRLEEITGDKLKYFVFTDSPDYARKLLQNITNVTYIDGNIGENSYRDMQLMSLCNYNIVANSTFSFWGAYLNENDDKIVIAPKTAANNCKYPFACHDWILL